jgi:hypothetical protein
MSPQGYFRVRNSDRHFQKEKDVIMNKLTKALCLSIVLCAAVFAQTTGDEYKKSEFYVGYSNQRVEIALSMALKFPQREISTAFSASKPMFPALTETIAPLIKSRTEPPPILSQPKPTDRRTIF